MNDLFGFVEVRTTNEVNNDAISADDRLSKGLGLALTVNNLDLIVRRRDSCFVGLDNSARELVGLLALAQGRMVVTHLLEKSVPNETVDSRDEDTFALLRLDNLCYDADRRCYDLGLLSQFVGGRAFRIIRVRSGYCLLSL